MTLAPEEEGQTLLIGVDAVIHVFAKLNDRFEGLQQFRGIQAVFILKSAQDRSRVFVIRISAEQFQAFEENIRL